MCCLVFFVFVFFICPRMFAQTGEKENTNNDEILLLSPEFVCKAHEASLAAKICISVVIAIIFLCKEKVIARTRKSFL